MRGMANLAEAIWEEMSADRCGWRGACAPGRLGAEYRCVLKIGLRDHPRAIKEGNSLQRPHVVMTLGATDIPEPHR